MKQAIVIALAVGVVFQWHGSAQQSSRPIDVGALNISATTDESIQEWDAQVDRWIRTGALRRREIVADPLLPDRIHERLQQVYGVIPVYGAEITRQFDRGVTVSLFGTVYPSVKIDPNPTINSSAARVIIEKLAGIDSLSPWEYPELTILPTQKGGFALTYRARVVAFPDLTVYFIDAHTGEVVLQYNDLKTQGALGTATGDKRTPLASVEIG